MKFTTLACITVVSISSWLTACTTPRQPFPATDLVASSAIPAADPALDHYIARVPGNVAQTATVARAMTHISLGRARDQAGQQLCAGDRLMPGEVAVVAGPFPTVSPDSNTHEPVWYYRISQQPGLRGCEAVDEARLFQAMQNSLPAWIEIERARPGYTELGLLE